MSPTEDYLGFYLSYPLKDLFQIFLLGMARILPVIALSPFFGGKVLSNTMKVGFTIVLVPIFLPILLANATATLSYDLIFMVLLVKETMIGFILGMFVSIPFYWAGAAGILIDHQRGAQSLQVMDPAGGMKSSPTGLLYSNILLVSFFTIGGPFLFFEALISTYQVVPSDRFLYAAFFSSEMPIWNATIKLLNTTITIGTQLAAPSLIVILMSDLFLGIANRMAPQVQISFLLWSLKAYLGIAILWAACWFILKQMDLQTLSWLKMLQKLAPGMGA